MSLKVYNLENSAEWDKIVRSFIEHDVYWLSGYVKAFEIHGDGTPLLFYYEDEFVRGINVSMKRDISSDKRFNTRIHKGELYDLSSPYGYGGWIIEGDNCSDLFNEYEGWCVSNNIVSEFVRFHPVIENHKCCMKSYDVVGLGNTITLNLESPEVIWSNITSKNRNVIRKAQKNGVHIYNGRFPDIYKKFKEIYDETMFRDEADEYYFFENDFYNSILYDLPYNSQMFYAEYEGDIIAASIMLFENGRINYHLSGSKRKYSSLAPTNLLLYETALWGSANGYKTLYLGGGVGSGEDSLFKFKKSFYRKDDLFRFYIGKKIFSQEKYEFLCKLRREENCSFDKSSFFPQYRTM